MTCEENLTAVLESYIKLAGAVSIMVDEKVTAAVREFDPDRANKLDAMRLGLKELLLSMAYRESTDAFEKRMENIRKEFLL